MFGTLIDESQQVLNEIQVPKRGYMSETLLMEKRNSEQTNASAGNKDSVVYSRGGMRWDIQPKLEVKDLICLY